MRILPGSPPSQRGEVVAAAQGAGRIEMSGLEREVRAGVRGGQCPALLPTGGVPLPGSGLVPAEKAHAPP